MEPLEGEQTAQLNEYSTLFLDGVSQSVRVTFTVWQTVCKAVEQRVSESDTQSVTKYCQRHRIWFKFRKKSCFTIQHNPKSKIQNPIQKN